MCGIAGFIGPPVDDATAKAVLTSIEHRGLDDEGVYHDGPACLLHRRLSILDVSDRAHQPMVDPETGVAIVFNGEIYNFRELKQKHAARPYCTSSDTEVILRLFVEGGLRTINELRGMFAIAIWDPRDRSLHLIRDRFGIKPLYWHKSEAGLAFGSEIKALLAFGVAAHLDHDTVYDYLAHGLLAHSPRTFFAGVEALPPGTILTVRADGTLSRQTYWSPMNFLVPEQAPVRLEDTEASLWAMFREVMDLHMVSDVPVGVTLSSGLDSTFLLHVLAANGQRRMDAFSYGFQETEYDEVRRIRASTLPLSIDHHTVTLKPDEVIESLGRAVNIFETPVGGVGTLGLYRVLQTAPPNGVKVVLAGEGSDETFGGYRYYAYSRMRDLHERGDASLAGECEAFGRIQGEALAPGSEAFRRKVLDYGKAVFAPDGTDLAGEAFLGGALANCRPEESWVRSTGWLGPIPQGASHFRVALLRDMFVQKIPKLLWFQDRLAMAWGVESRVPFLDHKLYEFVASLADDWLIRNGISKFILKRLYDRFCHLDVTETRKHFVSTPQREWIKGPLAGPIKNLIAGGELVGRGLVDYARFERAYDAYCAAPELGNSFFIWKVLNLELLLKQFFVRSHSHRPVHA